MSFTLDITAVGAWSSLTDHRVLQIPDLSTVYRDEPNGAPGFASATSTVHVDITHTYSGDLIISLIGTSGTVYTLRNGSAAVPTTSTRPTPWTSPGNARRVCGGCGSPTPRARTRAG